MNETVLVTGASGFIGRQVVRLLSEGRVGDGIAAVAFARSVDSDLPGVDSLRGDLLAPADLDSALQGVRCVVHLAAATGKASDAEMERVNVEGTRSLVDGCQRNGVGRLIHVSTIAVTYSDLSDYPYGRSKLAAERVVMESDLKWTIVRPTIVLGPGAPALGPLRSLASGPALMLPGGGRVAVQPIDVRDVATSLVRLAQGAEPAEAFAGKIIELGGPERLQLRDLLSRIRVRAGKGKGPAVHIPLVALRGVAQVATLLLGARSPVTPGQLSAFRFDSAAAPVPDGFTESVVYDVAAMLDNP